MWNQSKMQVEEQIGHFERGYARVDLDAIRDNMEKMHRHLEPGVRMIAVVKANAYGHGVAPIAKVLEPLDYVYGYATATAEEAFELRAAGLKKSVMILGHAFESSYPRLIREGICPSVFREDTLKALSSCGKETGLDAGVHIAVDTGMGRIGITPDDEGLAFVRKALQTPHVSVEGIFTHFARADEVDKGVAQTQLQKLTSFTDRIEKELGVRIPCIHASNSAAILELPEAHLDVVRAGITMYGLDPSPEVTGAGLGLRPALSLISHVSFLKTIHAGMSVSYGGHFTAERDTLVATVPLGYGDGYPRSLSGKGFVLIRGMRCPILGRVCMDQFMVDVSHVPGVSMGDEVLLLGQQGQEKITAEELGELSGRFNYELVCLLGTRIPRVYYLGGEPVCILSFS